MGRQYSNFKVRMSEVDLCGGVCVGVWVCVGVGVCVGVRVGYGVWVFRGVCVRV